MNIIEKNIDDLKEYKNNPRKNEKAIDYVAKSIKDFGFKVPIVIDENDTIVCGHTRFLACKKLEIEKIPCVVANDLNDEQIKAFRIADNKVSEFSKWDFEKLYDEIKQLEKIDFSQYGFEELGKKADFFEQSIEERNKNEDEDEEYNEFIEKFKLKKTTDDCYTPPIVYNEICNFVEDEYGVSRENFVRPFKPDGDFENEIYKENDIVVDNPPFSIESKIIDFYLKNNIKFFLFANGLTTLNLLAKERKITIIICDGDIRYENGADVNTNFVTNLDDENLRIRTAPSLNKKLNEVYKVCKGSKEITKYVYPKNIIKVTDIEKISHHEVKIYQKNMIYKHDLKNSEHCFGGCCFVSNEVYENICNLQEIKKIKEDGKEKEIEILLTDEEKKIIDSLK